MRLGVESKRSKTRKPKRVVRSSSPIRKKRAKATATAEKRLQPASKKRLAGTKLNNKLQLSGDLEWLLPMMETAYTPLVPRGTAGPQGRPMQISSLKPLSRAVLDPAVPTMWK